MSHYIFLNLSNYRILYAPNVKFFCRTHSHVLFWGPLVHLFWISGDVSSGFQSPNGFCLIRIAEVNVLYIPSDPPLVLHIANLLTDSIAGRRLGSYLAQGYYRVAAVSLEPAINRSYVPNVLSYLMAALRRRLTRWGGVTSIVLLSWAKSSVPTIRLAHNSCNVTGSTLFCLQ